MPEMFSKYFWFMFGKKEDGVYISCEEDEFFSSLSATKRTSDNSYFEESALKQ